MAERPGVAATASKQIALSRHRQALLKELHRTRDRALRSAVHEQLAQVSQALGLSVPEIDSIGRADPETPDVLKAFWEAVAYLEGAGERCNHAAPNSGKIYLNLPELQKLLHKHQREVAVGPGLTAALRHSKSPRFLKSGTFNSHYRRHVMRGWQFSIE